jgi:hypothetical protein
MLAPRIKIAYFETCIYVCGPIHQIQEFVIIQAKIEFGLEMTVKFTPKSNRLRLLEEPEPNE